jgi:hypothetical protein
MKYEHFTQKYYSWTRAPRSSDEAFRTADYASSVEIYTPTVKWRRLLSEVVLGVVGAVAAAVILLNLFRAFSGG